MAQVLFDEATRVYPGTELPASHDLDLAVADGEFLVLKGPPATEKPSSPPAAARTARFIADGRIIVDPDFA